MELIKSVLYRLLPIGRPWNFILYLKAFYESLSLNIERLKADISTLPTEGLPMQSDYILKEYANVLNLFIPENTPNDIIKGYIMSLYTATGGTDLEYIEKQIKLAFPNISISDSIEGVAPNETSYIGVGVVGCMIVGRERLDNWDNFYITGTVPNVRDLYKLMTLVEKLAPLNCVPIYNVVSIIGRDSCITGLGIVGQSIVGRDITI